MHAALLPARRPGTTLTELLVVMVVLAALAGIALPRLREAADRFAARSAAREAVSLFSFARRSAITRRAPVAVVLDTAGGTVVVRAGPAELARVSLRERYGVRISATRDSMSYDPRGLGYGAANLAVVARRGRGAETLYVSRLGRARR
ncbi:MAG TPA: GspH/FimT family pseudopilin [Gemmatimonadaceae bacterium]|nr:GspH/FimT family pseudopilin [Gemmatimonadaceae bacterium]